MRDEGGFGRVHLQESGARAPVQPSQKKCAVAIFVQEPHKSYM